MSTSARVIKNTGYLYLRLGISLIVSLWTTRIVLDALGVSNFGIYNVVGGIVSLLGFLNATLSTATQRYINFAEGRNDLAAQLKIFNNSFLLHLLLGIILVIGFIITGAICFNGLLDIPSDRVGAAKIVYVCMIVSTLASVMNVPYEASINAHEDMAFYAYVGIFEVLTKLAIAFVIQSATYDKLILYAILMMLVPIVTFVLVQIYCYKRYTECSISLRKYYDSKTIKELGKFAGWNFTNSASGMATQYGLNIVINHYFGVAINAAQGIAMQVSGVLVNISSNALKALNPIIVKSESVNQRERMIYVSLLGCRVTFLIFAIISFPLVVEMEYILSWWLKEVPEWAIIFCQLQLIRICTEMLTYSLNTSIMAHGDIKTFNIYKSAINILPLIVTIIMFAVGMAPFWMYLNWIICWSFLGGIINVVFAHKKVNLSYRHYLNTVIIPAIETISIPVILIVICQIYFDAHVIRLVVLSFSWLLLLVCSWKRMITHSERESILALCKNKIKK